MHRIKYCLLLLTICLAASENSPAQTFTTIADTVYCDTLTCEPPSLGSQVYEFTGNRIVNPSPTAMAINWRIIASDFPADWLPQIYFQDTAAFYSNSGLTLWNGTTGSTQTTTIPGAGSGFLYLDIDEMPITTNGTFRMELKLTSGATSKNIWFVVTRDISTFGDSISGPSQLCVGDRITLSGAPGGTWTAGNTDATISAGVVTGVTAGVDVITYAGNTLFIHSGSDSCGINVSNTKTVTINSLPIPVVSGFGGELNVASSYASYQWLFSSAPILGATSNIYDPTSNGNYAVTVTDANGCTGTSTAVYDANVSVPEIDPLAAGITIYPNPVSTVLNIESQAKVNATITALDGKVMLERLDVTALDLSNIPNGIYLLSVYDNKSGVKIKTQQITRNRE